MKHRLVKRDLGIEIPGFTDAVLSRLESPYAMITEWMHYVPLDVLLSMSYLALALGEDGDDGAVQLPWKGLLQASEDYAIPLDLFRRTRRYVESDKPSRPRYLGIYAPIFWSEGKPILASDVMAAIARVISAP